jgi:hypothetical protein
MPPVVVGAIVVLLLELSAVSGRLAGPGTCAFAPGASVFVAPPAIGAAVELLEFVCALATSVLIATATAVNINFLDNIFRSLGMRAKNISRRRVRQRKVVLFVPLQVLPTAGGTIRSTSVLLLVTLIVDVLVGLQ